MGEPLRAVFCDSLEVEDSGNRGTRWWKYRKLYELASSAGYNSGRRIVSSESFVFDGSQYNTPPESFKANSDSLFISGINEIIYSGFPYKFDRGTKGIGWYPFSRYSSQINEANPIWPFLHLSDPSILNFGKAQSNKLTTRNLA